MVAFARQFDSPGLNRELRHLFTCQEWDALAGLFYYDNRWYDTATGRFWSQDPISFAAGDANLYRYCGNDPTNKIDPTGLVGLGDPPPGRWPDPPPPRPTPDPNPASNPNTSCFNRFMREANRRRGNGPWGDSAQHCWAACFLGGMFGAGTFAACIQDYEDFMQGDSTQDILAQHFGGLIGDAIRSPFMSESCLSRICDIACRTWPSE